jgi:DNA-binding winged helix-turn-helix (wHTH) protein/TolB-like protein/tetratricopeptide (TPR) repeat protein
MERTQGSDGAITFRVGDWQVHPSRDVLVRNGEQVKIEPKSMEVLVRLALRAGTVVPQSEIESEVWKGLVVTSQSVYQAVAQLRRVLGDSPRAPQYIETVPRRGYRLVAPVEWGIRPDLENRPVSPPPAIEPPPVVTEAAAARSAPHRRRWIALPVIALMLLYVGWHYRATLFQENTQSIAVLGFEDLSPDASQAYLTQVLVEEVTSALGQVDGLKVVARDSARAASASGATVADIGRQLGVRHVLRGNVRREGDRVRVAAVLVETRTGYETWSRSLERPASAVSRLPADIAALVARAVGLALVGDPGVKGGRTSTRSPVAYDFYMLGLQRFSERTAFALSEARRYFEQAIESDPTFAAAYVALADVHIAEFYFANRQLTETLDLVVPLVDKAIALDPAFGPAIAMHGWIALERGDFAGAQADLEQAIDLSPNDAKARLWLSTVLFASAQPLLALAELDKALELDPLNFVAHLRRALVLDALGRHDDASEAADRAVTLAPKHPNPRWTLALIETSRGRIASAIAHYQAALALDASRSDLRVHLATLLLDAGRVADARRELAEAIQLAQSSHADLTARAYLALLDKDLDRLAAAAEAIASVEPRNRYLTMDAANFMTLAGRHADALHLFERALAEYPESLLHDLWMIRWGMESGASCLAVVYTAMGLEDERDRLTASIDRFIDDARDRGLHYWGLEYLAAAMAALAGEPTRAIAHLERASDAGWRRVWWARQDPALASLHERPEFNSLLERTAAQVAH